MHIDSELRQLRAIEAMAALEYLFDSIPPEEAVPARHVCALLTLANDAARAALPRAAAMMGANDEEQE